MHGSALQATSRNGHVNIVRLLLENDADVNAIGGSSGTALKAAARLDQLGEKNWWDAKEITRILLENGAHEENMTYGSEEDVDAHNYSSDTGSWSNAAVISDDEDVMLIFG
jgi:ankyrin repeat protein